MLYYTILSGAQPQDLMPVVPLAGDREVQAQNLGFVFLFILRIISYVYYVSYVLFIVMAMISLMCLLVLII